MYVHINIHLCDDKRKEWGGGIFIFKVRIDQMMHTHLSYFCLRFVRDLNVNI